MALIFQRLARNFIKNGYFPTDEVTIARVLNALDIAASEIRILDPCCGEGTALGEVKHHLSECGATVHAMGIEFDAERAWHAKQLLDVVAHADVNDVFITARTHGLLFLNPPYGDVVSDKAATGDGGKRERLEKIFLRKTMPWLQCGGIGVLIVPYYILDGEFASLVARNFDRVRVFMAPEKKFKQCVIFGIKRRSDAPAAHVLNQLAEAKEGKAIELPEGWTDAPYEVPAMTDAEEYSFTALRIDAAQLKTEVAKFAGSTLWPQFGHHFTTVRREHRRPLRDLSKWHLALALAAGQICGVVKSASGRTLLVKGNTFKEKEIAIDQQVDEEGRVQETRTLTDKFVPVIRGIDFTPGPGFGKVVTIR